VPASVSAGLIATLAGVDPTSVAKLEVEPAGADVTLQTADVAVPTDFVGGLQAVFYDNGSGVATFRRPNRTPSDLNGADTQQLGASLTVAITTVTPVLDVQAAVNHVKTTVNARLKFTVTAANPKAGETLTATWDFRDGKTARATLKQSGGTYSAVVTHAFRKAGTYSAITVTVHGSQGSAGSGSIKRIVVGSAPGAPGPGTKHRNRHQHSTSGSPTTTTTQPAPTSTPKVSHHHTSTHSVPSHTAKHTTHRHSTPVPKTGTEVSGVLISSTTPEGSLSPSAAQGVGGTSSSGGSAPLGGIAATLAVLGVAGCGALRERRRLRADWWRSV
jgi:hypothetical protein